MDFNFFKNIFNPKKEITGDKQPSASLWNETSLTYINEVYDGEKTDGGMGSPKNYIVDHYRLSQRSFQSFLESDIGQTALNKYTKWVIGSGLDLNADPNESLLKLEGIEIDEDEFSDAVETRFKSYAGSTISSHSGESSLHGMAFEAHKEAIVGGDCLIIQRFSRKTGLPTIQIVEGKYVMTPNPEDVENKNGRCVNGVQVDASGKHLGYWVQVDAGKYEYVEAYSISGYRMSWLVYGKKYRSSDVRGIPLTSAVMETIQKLDRYKEATVGSAEERQKIAFQIIRNAESDGSTPVMAKLQLSAFWHVIHFFL